MWLRLRGRRDHGVPAGGAEEDPTEEDAVWPGLRVEEGPQPRMQEPPGAGRARTRLLPEPPGEAQPARPFGPLHSG